MSASSNRPPDRAKVPSVNEVDVVKLVARMLDTGFVEAPILRTQLSGLHVRANEFGNSRLTVTAGLPAEGCRGVVADAEAADLDGATVYGVLHVIGGYLFELQTFRGDGKAIQKLLAAEDFEVVYPANRLES
jgi:hypothetical protein